MAIGSWAASPDSWQTAQGWALYFPYSLLSVGMRANNPNMEIDLAQLALSTLVYTVLFAALSVRLLAQRDVTGD